MNMQDQVYKCCELGVVHWTNWVCSRRRGGSMLHWKNVMEDGNAGAGTSTHLSIHEPYYAPNISLKLSQSSRCIVGFQDNLPWVHPHGCLLPPQWHAYWMNRWQVPLLGSDTALPSGTLENYMKLWVEYIENLPHPQSSPCVLEVAIMTDSSIDKTHL